MEQVIQNYRGSPYKAGKKVSFDFCWTCIPMGRLYV